MSAVGQRRPDIDTDDIVERYRGAGQSSKAIALDLRCSGRTVLKRLRTAGVEPRGQGKHAKPKGPLSQYWKGGRIRDGKGYWRLKVDGRSVLEHDYLVEQAIGRLLADGEVVHHFNSLKGDNDAGNLFLTNRQQHPKLHAAQTRHCLAGHPSLSAERRAAEPFLSWWLELHVWACEAIKITKTTTRRPHAASK